MRIDLTKRLSHKELKRPVKEYLSHFELVFSENLLVKDVLAAMQAKTQEKRVEYFYVIDGEGILLGLVSFIDLLYESSDTPLSVILDPEVIKIQENDPLEKALKILTYHQILFLPVVSIENKFLGVLDITPHNPSYSKTSKGHTQAVKEDIFQFIGFSIEQGKYKSSFVEFRYRMPWLLFNLVGGLICAVIGEIFQMTLVEFVVLALFIPLVLTLSESIGIQSMTFSLRFLHFRKIHWSQVGRRIFAEWKTSILLGITCALLLSAFYFAWSIEFKPILAISVSMLISMMCSALFGALFPIILHILSLDPKVAAGPIVLMMADIITFAIYLGLSTWILI